MFYYFFDEYKEKIYKGSRRKLVWYEILMIVVLMLSSICNCIIAIMQLKLMLIYIPLAIMVVDIIFMSIYVNKRQKKERDYLLNEYKKNHINALENLLKKQQYNLYSVESIDWVIDCCRNKSEQNEGLISINKMKKFFTSTIYPIYTLCLGLILKNISTEDAIIFTIDTSMIVIAVLIFGIMIKPIIIFLIYPEKSIIEYLQSELTYIKTQIKTTPHVVDYEDDTK